MAVNGIRLQNFRSYGDESFEFSPSVNIVVGPNTSGKTNLLEAILVVAQGSSYRARDSELVAFASPWARLDALTDTSERTVKIVTEPEPAKTFEIAGKTLKRLTLPNRFPTVLFEPDHLSLLRGSPEKRRDYLDDLLSKTTIGYGSIIRSFRRTLAQRNKLLKTPHTTNEQLFPWNVRLSELAGTIVRSRLRLAVSINEKISGLYQELSHSRTRVSLSYVPGAQPEQYESQMLHQLESRLASDLTRGFTSFGPHREDFVVLFDAYPAETVASRGETRTLVLALKLIELEVLEKQINKSPLLLLDDVFSELDGIRRKALTARLQHYQTFITTTDADIVLKHFSEQSNIVLLSNKQPV